MKRIVISSTLSALLLCGIAGCSSESSDSTKESVAPQHKEISSSKSEADRKEILNNKLKSLTTMGFAITNTLDNQKMSSYTISVTDTKVATINILSKLNMSSIDRRTKEKIEEAIKDAQIGVDIDWQKYLQNAKGSVLTYLVASKNASKALKELSSDKKIAAYLTFGANDNMLEAIFKDIDYTISDNSEKAHLSLVGAKILTHTPSSKDKDAEAFSIYGGKMSYKVDDNQSNSITVSYENPKCDIEMQNSYLGSELCNMPILKIDGDNNGTNFSTLISDIKLNYATKLHGNAVKSDIDFKISTIDISSREDDENITVSVKDINLNGYADNLNSKMIEEFHKLSTSLSTDANQTDIKNAKLISGFFDSNATYSYTLSLASVDGKFTSKKEATNFSLEGYKTIAKASFGDNINYNEKSNIQNISVKDAKSGVSQFELENFQFNYSIKDMYNLFPALISFGADVSQNTTTDINEKDEKALQEILSTLSTHGVEISFSPIGIDKLVVDSMGQQITNGKIGLTLNAKLSPNKIKLNSPMATMMLLKYLKADGKLVMQKADLDRLSKSFSPQIIAMVMMYAKYEGDKVIFNLKFSDGHLLVNDKPVM
jgi:hypothetical protein